MTNCSRCQEHPATYTVSQSDGSGPDMRVCYQCVKEAIKPKYCNLRIERLPDDDSSTNSKMGQ